MSNTCNTCLADGRCKVCGEPGCPVDVTVPQPAPWMAVSVAGDTWVNVPIPYSNWNWQSTRTGGGYCWEDLLHKTHPSPPPFVELDGEWICVQCESPWAWFDPATTDQALDTRTCPDCGQDSWPAARERGTCDWGDWPS